MKAIALFSAIVFAHLFSQAQAHPYHHSVAVFDFNPQTKQLELSLKMLSEDYEKIKNKTTLKNTSSIQDYINKHLQIDYNSTALTAKLEGQEFEREFVWFYLSYSVEISAQNNVISVQNTLLKAINKNQFNTVKITLLQNSQAHNYSATESRYTFVFD